jgi:hypothetical protein
MVPQAPHGARPCAASIESGAEQREQGADIATMVARVAIEVIANREDDVKRVASYP